MSTPKVTTETDAEQKTVKVIDWTSLRELALNTAWTDAVKFIHEETEMNMVSAVSYAAALANKYPQSHLLATCPMVKQGDYYTSHAVNAETLRIVNERKAP